MSFWQKLETSIRWRDSLLCVGLDPDPERIPTRYSSVLDFLKAVVDATANVACIYKPNIAFYEAMGEDGLSILRQILDYIPWEIPILLDAKRNDISSTATAYARSVFERWGVDAVTVNPYLGRDGVEPFLAYEERGVFVLCKTSNLSASDVQDWSQGGEPLYRHVARLVDSWAMDRPVGLVVGATYPEAVAELRAQSPRTWFLVPGVGAQGGEVDAVVRAGLRDDGLGLIINASRSILYADDPAAAAMELRAQINRARARAHKDSRSMARDSRQIEIKRLACALYDAGCVRLGDFVLHSGAHSPIYVDLRRLVTYPGLLEEVARAYAGKLLAIQYDRLAAIPYAALPIGTAVSLQTGKPLIYPRREAKGYGTMRQIEGEYHAGEKIVLLDDLITTGGSKLEAMQPLVAEGLTVEDVVVLIDREQGGREDLAEHGLSLQAVLTLRELVDALEQAEKVSAAEAATVRDYLEAKA